VVVSSIATEVANPELQGVHVEIVHTAPVDNADFVGHSRWSSIAGTALGCGVEPFRPVLWRSGESCRVVFQEVDTNATPTGDLSVTFRVLRLRAP